MSDQCKDCIYIENLNREVSELKLRVTELEGKVSGIEKNVAVSQEQMKMVFNILNEIKDSIKDIGKKLEKLEDKPAEAAEKIKIAVITSVCTGIIGIALGYIFGK